MECQCSVKGADLLSLTACLHHHFVLVEAAGSMLSCTPSEADVRQPLCLRFGKVCKAQTASVGDVSGVRKQATVKHAVVHVQHF